jgi:hypothetical protein
MDDKNNSILIFWGQSQGSASPVTLVSVFNRLPTEGYTQDGKF